MNYRLLILIFCIPITIFCCKSNEDKATELIKEDMFKTLYDFDSYEPIETIIDTAFYRAYMDTAILMLAYQQRQQYKLFKEYSKEAARNIEYAKIWANPFSRYSMRKFNEYVSAYKTAQKNMESTTELIIQLSDSIYRLKADIDTNKYCGWKIQHKFRCKTKGGYSTICDYLYIADPNFKKILYKFDTNSEDYKEMLFYCGEGDGLSLAETSKILDLN